MGTRRGRFSSLLESKEKTDDDSPWNASTSITYQEGSPSLSPETPDLSLDDLKVLLESLRTAAVSLQFQEELTQLRQRDWGAFQKRQGFARVLGAAWKGPMRAAGLRIDGSAFPALIRAVRSHAFEPGIKTLSEEVERQLRFVPGALFGSRAGELKGYPSRTRERGAFSKAVDGQAPAVKSEPSQARRPTGYRSRELNRGEARDMLQAFLEIARRTETQRTVARVHQKGGQRIPALISSLLDETMRRFDYPTTAKGYEQMARDAAVHGCDQRVKEQLRELERLFMLPAGFWFRVPTDQDVEPSGDAGAQAFNPAPTLTLEQGRELQRCLLRHFRDEAFQQKRRALSQVHMEGSAVFYRERQKLFLSVQSKVLPDFGFGGDSQGVCDMIQAYELLGPDEEIMEQGYEINVLLGLADELGQADPSRPQAAGEELHEVELLVHIDRGMGLKSTVHVQRGATVQEAKERLSAEDPTGGLRAEDVGLRLLDSVGGRELRDDELLTEAFTEVDICERGQ